MAIPSPPCPTPRSINFSEDHPDSEKVRSLVCSAAGVTPSYGCPILSSLPCELMFNDCRDSERRHRKAEVSRPSNIACVCVRSTRVRSPLKHVTVESSDWAGPSPYGNNLRASVLQPSKDIDRDLGINMRNLTLERTCPHLTKPLEYATRLRLFKALGAAFREQPDINFEQTLDNSWPATLLTTGTLWQDAVTETTRLIVRRCQKHVVRHVAVQEALTQGDVTLYRIDNTDAPRVQEHFLLAEDLPRTRLSQAVPVPHQVHGLLCKPREWLNIDRYLCEVTILEVSASSLLKYCQAKKIKVGQKPHRERVKAVLEHHGYDDEYIQQTLEALPVRERKKKEARPTCNIFHACTTQPQTLAAVYPVPNLSRPSRNIVAFPPPSKNRYNHRPSRKPRKKTRTTRTPTTTWSTP